jgi:hypothetical protein
VAGAPARTAGRGARGDRLCDRPRAAPGWGSARLPPAALGVGPGLAVRARARGPRPVVHGKASRLRGRAALSADGAEPVEGEGPRSSRQSGAGGLPRVHAGADRPALRRSSRRRAPIPSAQPGAAPASGALVRARGPAGLRDCDGLRHRPPRLRDLAIGAPGQRRRPSRPHRLGRGPRASRAVLFLPHLHGGPLGAGPARGAAAAPWRSRPRWGDSRRAPDRRAPVAPRQDDPRSLRLGTPRDVVAPGPQALCLCRIARKPRRSALVPLLARLRCGVPPRHLRGCPSRRIGSPGSRSRGSAARPILRSPASRPGLRRGSRGNGTAPAPCSGARQRRLPGLCRRGPAAGAGMADVVGRTVCARPLPGAARPPALCRPRVSRRGRKRDQPLDHSASGPRLRARGLHDSAARLALPAEPRTATDAHLGGPGRRRRPRPLPALARRGGIRGRQDRRRMGGRARSRAWPGFCSGAVEAGSQGIPHRRTAARCRRARRPGGRPLGEAVSSKGGGASAVAPPTDRTHRPE